jgi:type IV pilus assembly protein PilE
MRSRYGATGSGRRNHTGVTLIELMIVVVVIGILGMIALPSYRQYTLRTHRTEAKAALLQVATNQERYYLENRTYGTTEQLAAAGYPMTSEHGIYAITIANASATGYTAIATPVSGGGTNGVDMTIDTHCAQFTINHAGVRGATNDDCW